MMKFETLTPIQRKLDEPELINPIRQDAYRMGHDVGTNVMLMLENFEDKHCSYFIIVDRKTGERVKVTFVDETEE